MTHAGRFLSFEGLDGCGKSTQASLLAARLRAEGLAVVETREPGGTAFGEEARALLLGARKGSLAPTAELALMFASRAQLVAEIIRPALAGGAWVLCDRFVDSSEAYQGAGRGLGPDAVHMLHGVLAGRLKPDLTVWLKLPPEQSLARARGRAARGRVEEPADSFERENLAFFERVHEGYRRIAQREQERVLPIDAGGAPEAIHEAIYAELRRRFAECSSAQLTHQVPRAALPFVESPHGPA